MKISNLFKGLFYFVKSVLSPVEKKYTDHGGVKIGKTGRKFRVK